MRTTSSRSAVVKRELRRCSWATSRPRKTPRFSTGKPSAAAQTARSCESDSASMPPWCCGPDECQPQSCPRRALAAPDSQQNDTRLITANFCAAATVFVSAIVQFLAVKKPWRDNTLISVGPCVGGRPSHSPSVQRPTCRGARVGDEGKAVGSVFADGFAVWAAEFQTHNRKFQIAEVAQV